MAKATGKLKVLVLVASSVKSQLIYKNRKDHTIFHGTHCEIPLFVLFLETEFFCVTTHSILKLDFRPGWA